MRMLQITIPSVELWDENTKRFIRTKEQTLQLEHSLVSLRKWESKWHKPFLGKSGLTDDRLTDEELLDYIRCMTITQNVDPSVYLFLSQDNIKQINEYINNPMTATWFSDDKDNKKGHASREQVTAEIIYYWMIGFQIPVEFQKWHLNQLLTLIKVCEIKNQPPKKRSKKDILSRNAALNKARREKLKSKG